MSEEKCASALSKWALGNPTDAAKVWRLLQLNPGGMRDVYLPRMPSTELGQCSVTSPLVA